ncbi:MAG: ChaN family lipoprotein [Pirellulaceae bacterium]|nr:ChaN family lipoprotein [Pirellulaceae bacterium]
MCRYSLRIALLLLTSSWAFNNMTAAAEDARPAWSAPEIRDAVSVRDGQSGDRVAFDRFLDNLAQADVVFLGETHDDETTHRLQLAIYEGLLERRSQRVVLAMEMFERDVQPVLDDYVSQRIAEPEFLARSRPWGNYRTAYRPLIERARQAQGKVIASNFPRPLRGQVAAQGAAALEALTPEQRAHVPRAFHPNTDAYWRRVDNAVRGHAAMLRAGGTDAQSRLYSVQSLWDNAMGEACADAVDRHPDHLVLHVNGGFHSAYWDGTVHQFKLRKPDAQVRTVSIVPATSAGSSEVRGAPVADFVAFVDALATDLSEESYSVYGQQQTRYRLHVPAQACAEQPVPLLICLVDDGFTAADGLELWRDRLGTEAALVVIDPPYREMQEDLSVGGRWFWPDSFARDIGNAVSAVESTWAYVARYFPIDPHRVCVAGEGAGATVAVATALLVDRMHVRSVAVAPRQYAKLKDIPLPLPELFGSGGPPSRSLTVLGQSDDVTWWEQELQQYRDVGVAASVVLRTDDPWAEERQVEQAIREALACAPLPPAPDGPRRGMTLAVDAPRARHWARLHAGRLTRQLGTPVAVVREGSAAPAVVMSTTIHPGMLSADGALPRCPGPFGGTTVLVLPPDIDTQTQAAWHALADSDPLAKASRFHRLRLAMASGTGDLPAVLRQLQSENRKNILIVPAVFCAPSDWIRALRGSVRELENQMTLQWLPGLGGQSLSWDQPAESAELVPLRHVLEVTLVPATGDIQVRDRLELPSSLCQAGTEFTLDAKLQLLSSAPSVKRLEEPDADGHVRYRLAERIADGVLAITYQGKMDYGLSDEKEQYTRGFRQTRGSLSEAGVYLDQQSRWIPYFNDALVRFSMQVQLPDGWHVISQGQGTSDDGQHMARWESPDPVDQIYLVGGPLLRYRDAAGAVETLVYLREADEGLARKYLDTGAQYLEMYRQLIGPYPYSKFAVVENFWETGYGMPSFTLLGPQVIRFPFILHSSYPHEILHNWWGNSVFVEPTQGNWCEGLTAYLADHLVQEQRGTGHEYRRTTLQKYRNYVQESRDFPLSEFRERHSAATEAVGYGKALMLNHMLRRQIGDEAFRAGLAEFYRQHRGQRVGYDQLRAAFESAAQVDLRPFFEQWTRRAGAPVLETTDVEVQSTQTGWSDAARPRRIVLDRSD